MANSQEPNPIVDKVLAGSSQQADRQLSTGLAGYEGNRQETGMDDLSVLNRRTQSVSSEEIRDLLDDAGRTLNSNGCDEVHSKKTSTARETTTAGFTN